MGNGHRRTDMPGFIDVIVYRSIHVIAVKVFIDSLNDIPNALC